MESWNRLYLLLNAILNSLYLIQQFSSRMFVRRLLITNAIQFSPKNISSVISRTRFGCKTDLVAYGTLTSMSKYSLAHTGKYAELYSYQLCLQCINFSLNFGLVRLICLFVWFPDSGCGQGVRCVLWAGWSCCPTGWTSYELCISIWGSISRHSVQLVGYSDTWKVRLLFQELRGTVRRVIRYYRATCIKKQFWYSIFRPPYNTRHTARDNHHPCLPSPLPSLLFSVFDLDIPWHNWLAVSSNWRDPALPWRRQIYMGFVLLHIGREDGK